MAQEVKVLATKFISGTHMMKREPTLKLLWLSHIKQFRVKWRGWGSGSALEHCLLGEHSLISGTRVAAAV